VIKTKIDWCSSTWNPVTGCLHGCEYCYARSIAHRFSYEGETLDAPVELQRVWIEDGKGSGAGNRILRYPVSTIDGRKVSYPFGFKPTLHRYKMDEPSKWKKGRNIFVCSMADLFGAWVPDSWIEEVFQACEKAPQHNYLFLTKNPRKYVSLALSDKLPKRDNMWYGSTITNPDMDAFFGKEYNTFWSIEPILKPFGKMEEGKKQLPNWIIIGAETGRRKGKVIPKREWIENIVCGCRKADISVFMKSSLADIWGESLIQEFPDGLKKIAE